MIARAALLCLLLVGALAAPASASPSPPFPGERPAPAIVVDAARVGTAVWQARWVMPCPHPRLLTARWLGTGIAGYADPSTCTLWVLRGIVRLRSWRPYLCMVVTHELGHLAGLLHTRHGIMSIRENTTPWDCRIWALRRSRRY